MQHVGSFGFQTFKPVFCMYNKLRLHALILSQWLNDVIFSRSNPLKSNRSVLNVSNGGPWNPKLTLKINSLWIKLKAQNITILSVKRTRFQNLKKRKWSFIIVALESKNRRLVMTRFGRIILYSVYNPSSLGQHLSNTGYIRWCFLINRKHFSVSIVWSHDLASL